MSDIIMSVNGIDVVDPGVAADILTGEVQRVLDARARDYGYDSIATAITYRGDPNPKFAAEAEGFFVLRSATWTTAYAILAEVLAGTRPFPTIPEAIALLPTLTITYP